MTWRIPDWWQFVLLVLAAYRIYRLIGWDDLPPIQRIRDRTLEGRPLLAHFVACAFCLGFWVCLAWWLAWIASPNWTTVAAVPFALSTVVGTWAKTLDR